MKKILCLLIMILLPLVVLADAAGPSIIGFDAVITNKNGVKNYDVIIPYNTKIHINDNDVYDGVYQACTMDGEQCFSVKASDIMVLKKELTPKDIENDKNVKSELVKEDVRVIISNKNGAKVRKGPPEIYKATKTIPYQLIIKSKYYTNGYAEHSYPYVSWIYVDTDEYKGWIDREDFAQIEDGMVMIFKDMNLYDASGKVVKKLNKGHIISGLYKDGYINYENKVLSYKDSYFGYEATNGYALIIKSANLTSSDGKALTGIPTKTKVKILYGMNINSFDDEEEKYSYTDPICVNDTECYYYVEYNGQQGFIDAKYAVSLKVDYKEETKTFTKDMDLYDLSYNLKNPNENESYLDYLGQYKINTITSITVVTSYTTNEIYRNYNERGEDVKFALVNYNGVFGWVVTDYEAGEEPKEEKPATPNPVVEDKPIKSNDIIIYSIIAAVVIGISALATILILNKKKKNKKQEDKKENIEVKKEEVKEEKKSEEQKEEIKKEPVSEESGVIIPPEPEIKEESEKNKEV